MLQTCPAKTRDRVEVLMLLPGGGYLVEKLLDTRYPESIGKLRCPGGKIEAGETPRDAAVRELVEEYGLTVLPHTMWYDSTTQGRRGPVVRLCLAASPSWIGLRSVEGSGETLVMGEEKPIPWS